MPPPVDSTSTIDNFPNFYQNWLERQRGFLEELLQINNDEHKEERQLGLINEVLAHYLLYHEEIFKAAGEDVFRVLSVPWLTTYERTLLWISGFRPSIVFRLVQDDLTAEQAASVEEVKTDVRRRERELTEAMASLQEMVAAPPIVRLVDGEVCEMNNAMEEMKMGMLGIFYGADLLRGSTMKMVMEILSNDQTVKLLAAAIEYQLRIRRWGQERDLQRTRRPTATATAST